MIKEYRERKGLTQKELAKLLKCAQSSISVAENKGSVYVEHLLEQYMRRSRAINKYKQIQDLVRPAFFVTKKKSLVRRIIDGIKRVF